MSNSPFLYAEESFRITEIPIAMETDFQSSSDLVPKIDSNPSSPVKPRKERLMELLEQVEVQVERIRRDAIKLEEEKDALLMTLDTLKNSDLIAELTEHEREQLLNQAEFVSNRCMTVEVMVRTHRDGMQEEALHQVNSYIDRLVITLREDPFGTKTRCISFMNACSSRMVDGATDKNFETAILGCTIDDQKRVKKRLQGLLDYIDQLSL